MLKDKELTHKFLKDQREYYNERADLMLDALSKLEGIFVKTGRTPYKEIGFVVRELTSLSEMLASDAIISMTIIEALVLNQIENQQMTTTLLEAYERSAESGHVEFGKLFESQKKIRKDIKSLKKHKPTLTWLEDYIKNAESATNG